MEKKGSRSVQPSSKGLATESKKNQDVVNKPWPRGGRRREPNTGTFPKNETRKPAPQRNKAVDKRPRPRGCYYSGAASGKEDAGLEVQEAELGSVFVQGSKKQSLNHLLNFHFGPREGQQSGVIHSKSGHRWTSTLKHKYNKEQFLQANCQFIVQESGDYKAYMNNPDSLVNWDLIEQVNIHVLEFPSCPICLYPPVAAKMTRCGHIYCWSCVLHYLALSDKTWRKCPICYEAVHKKDLKSVVAVPHATFKINETITFKLMKRLRGSLIAYPVEQQMQESDAPFNVSNKMSSDIYSKLLLAGNSEVQSIIERERKELVRQLAEDENCPEKCFIEQALSFLQEREQSVVPSTNNFVENQNFDLMQSKVKIQCENFVLNAQSNIKSEFNDWFNDISNHASALESMDLLMPVIRTSEVDVRSLYSSDRERYGSVSSDNLGSEELNSNIDAPTVVEDLEIIPPETTGQQSSKYFYFYQASDGQHIYLHAVNVRMLEHTYGCLEFCPKSISGRILEKESGSMTEDLRKRLRYLQHLPVTCQFEVAEIQLKSPVISKETVEHFQDQIETRRKRRQRRARDEKRREKRIAEEENKKMGNYAAANIRLESQYQFPDFQPELAKAGPALGEDAAQASPHSERSLSPSSAISNQTGSGSASGSLNTENEYAGLSFAKMLSSNKAPSTAWPVRKSCPPASSSNTAVVGSAKSSKTNDSDTEVEGYVPVPAFNQSFGDAIALALEKAALGNDVDETKMCGKKKKKNKQKKVLFATSMAFSGN